MPADKKTNQNPVLNGTVHYFITRTIKREAVIKGTALNKIYRTTSFHDIKKNYAL